VMPVFNTALLECLKLEKSERRVFASVLRVDDFTLPLPVVPKGYSWYWVFQRPTVFRGKRKKWLTSKISKRRLWQSINYAKFLAILHKKYHIISKKLWKKVVFLLRNQLPFFTFPSEILKRRNFQKHDAVYKEKRLALKIKATSRRKALKEPAETKVSPLERELKVNVPVEDRFDPEIMADHHLRYMLARYEGSPVITEEWPPAVYEPDWNPHFLTRQCGTNWYCHVALSYGYMKHHYLGWPYSEAREMYTVDVLTLCMNDLSRTYELELQYRGNYYGPDGTPLESAIALYGTELA